jgi:glycosyltransferase involved in cell wall biosynthesis
MTEPLIHVVMPTYNREKTLAISVESIIKQTHENWHLVIVDDSSTDNSAAVINKLVERDKRISTKKNTEYSHSCAGARLSGLTDINGDYIAFLDSDDTWPEYHLSEFVSYLESNKDIDYVFGDIRRVNPLGDVIVKSKFQDESGLPSELDIDWQGDWGKIAGKNASKIAIKSRFNTGMHTALFRSFFFEVTPLRDVYGCEDALLTMEALNKNMRIAVCKKIHLNYLIHDDNVSSVGTNMTFKHLEKNSLSEINFYENLIPKYLKLSAEEERSRVNKLADLYVWYLAYNTYSKFGMQKQALKYILKGIKLRPYSLRYYKSLIANTFKSLRK